MKRAGKPKSREVSKKEWRNCATKEMRVARPKGKCSPWASNTIRQRTTPRKSATPTSTVDTTKAAEWVKYNVRQRSRGPIVQARCNCAARSEGQTLPLFCRAILPWYIKMELKIQSKSRRQKATRHPTLQAFLKCVIAHPKSV